MKMYFDLEQFEVDEEEKEYILYRQLKKLIRYLNECEVMEVFSDHIAAFHLMFDCISCIIKKSREMKPIRLPIVYDEDEDEDEETLTESSYISEKYESERLKKKIIRFIDG